MIKKKEKDVTNLELLQSINRSFSKVEEKMATKEDLKNLEARMATKTDIEGLKEEIKGVKNQLEGTNKRIDDMSMNRVKNEDHNKLKSRVDFLETRN
jgi:RAB protein geranylgeranyltransferase component A